MTLEDEVRVLSSMDLEGLRAEWRQRYGAPPPLRSVELMRYTIAWRIQTDALGGLDKALCKRLASGSNGPEHRLAIGTRIAREWKGIRHEVEVSDGGFIFAGQRFQSLSEIARSITGTRCNGPRFFGLRKASN